MLALVTYKFIYHCYGKSVLYRISAGCCSIIVGGAYQSLMLNNRQLVRVFFMPHPPLFCRLLQQTV